MSKAPCLNCEDRKIGCHSQCEKYSNFRKEIDLINSKRRELNSYIGYMVDVPYRKASNKK